MVFYRLSRKSQREELFSWCLKWEGSTWVDTVLDSFCSHLWQLGLIFLRRDRRSPSAPVLAEGYLAGESRFLLNFLSSVS